MKEQLQKLDPEIIQTFLQLKDYQKVGISQSLGQYILQLNDASILHLEYPSISECARKLQEKYPKLSYHTCRSRIYDSINYLNNDCNVTSVSWNLYYADRMEELAASCIEQKNYKQATICLENALKYRLEASANVVDPNRVKFKPIIVSPDIQLPRMGIKPQGLMNAHKVLVKFINERDIPDIEKQRLIGEASREMNVLDVDHEDA